MHWRHLGKNPTWKHGSCKSGLSTTWIFNRRLQTYHTYKLYYISFSPLLSDPSVYHYDCYDGIQYYRLPYLLDRIECTSHEEHLSQCNHTTSSDDDYFRFHRTQFAVECQIAGESKLIVLVKWLIIILLYTHSAVPGEPQSVQIASTASSIISLTWSPPLVSERQGLTIFGYIINCSADHSSLGNTHLHTDIHNATLVNLHPFTAYNCCVAANSSNGRGRLACLRAVTCNAILTVTISQKP